MPVPLPAPPHRLVAALVALALAGTACSGSRAETAAAGTTSTTARPTTTAAPTTTTEAPTTTTTTAAPQPASLGPGAKGDDVLRLEERLAATHYDPGKVDGVYDDMTHHAVMAFQKVNGLSRDGRAGPETLAAVETAPVPAPMLPAGGATRIEVDLKRQVLFLYKDGALLRTLSVSTGNNKRYCVDGECATAVTPGGSFRITRRIKGIRVSRLGKLWNPLYFNGGIAIHGSPSVPAGPASHGCVRIPIAVSAWFYDTVPNGTPVYVLGGKRAAVPFNEPAPTDAPQEAPEPATTAPPPTEAPSTTTSSTTTSSTTSTTTTSTTSTTTPPAPAP